MKLPLSSLLFSLSLAVHAMGSVLVSDDFSTDTPGQAPSSAVSFNDVLVVDSATVPADPFGPEGNHSLMLRKTSAGYDFPIAQWSYEPTVSGTVKFTAYTVEDAPTASILSVFLGENNFGADGDYAIGFWFSGTTTWLFDGSEVRSIPNSWTSNAPREVVVAYFENATFSIYVDGEILSHAGNSVFGFWHETGSVDIVRLSTSDSASSNSLVFINEIEVVSIPEPSSAYLLLPVIFGCAAWRKMSRHA